MRRRSAIVVERLVGYAPGVPNEWRVKAKGLDVTSADVEQALILVKTAMLVQLDEEGTT
jgi:hypothetical protein